MHSRALLASGLWVASASAFQNTSPFILLSTSSLESLPPIRVATSHRINEVVPRLLQDCKSDVYILAAQPGVAAEDLERTKAATHLGRRAKLEDDSVEYAYVVPEVVGQGLDIAAVKDHLSTKCAVTSTVYADAHTGTFGTADTYPYILQLNLPSLPTSLKERTAKLAEHDSFMNIVIAELGDRSYTLIYHATPPSHAVSEATLRETSASPATNHEAYDWESEHVSEELIHSDLKRDMSGHVQGKRQERPSPDVALFEKYNFLSPGIFMGGVALILLFSIGTVGISALSSVEVSYAAFSKEMGPAAQKKQQ